MVDFVPIQVSAVDVKSVIASFVAILFAVVVAKLGSSPSAAANSFKVSSVLGALSVIDATIFVAVS